MYFNFLLSQNSLFIFWNSLDKIVDSEYSTGDYKSLEISIGAIIKHAEILRSVPYHLKIKKMCKDAVKKLKSCRSY